MVADETSPWLDVAGAARHLGVTEHWVRRHSAQMPHGRVGVKLLRFHREHLDQWVANGGLTLAEASDRRPPSSRAGRVIAASAARTRR